MLGLGSKDYDESVKNTPCDDSYPMVFILYGKNSRIEVNTLSLTVLDLISKGQIRCDIDLDESYEVGKKLTPDDMEVMKAITLRIANKGEIKTSETMAINLLKNLNKSKKFNLKSMAKQTNSTSIANKFEDDFNEYVKALKSENQYDGENYKDILENGKLTAKGKQIKKEWNIFQDYLKSFELSERYPPETDEESSSQLIYASCFDIERDALKTRQNGTPLSEFIDRDGYKLLNIIFNNALLNVNKKQKGTGIFYGVNDKYTIPGGG